VLIGIAILVVFGWVLPQFIDYDDVWQALTQLDGWEVLILFALGLARVPSEALMYRAFLPGLGLWRGSEAYLSSNLASQLLPPPSASIVQFGYFRGAGYEPDAAGLAAFGSFVFPAIGRFLLPIVALVLLLATGEVTGTVWLAGGLAIAISGIAGIACYLLLRAERSASWLGAKLQRPLSRILVRLGREPFDDGAGKAVGLRTRALAILREGWALGTIGVAANLVLTYLILLGSLRFVGVTSAELSAPAAFAAFAIAFWAGAVFPITGSGLGVVDAVLIAMLVELGSASDDALVAAALLWRVFYSVITLPLGAITLARFRKAPATGMSEAPTA
jgi:uncharacterized membrane protein YbhN (UPF0104 family)